ncbi:hypothetical protein ACT3RP_06480 [Halomonas sp. AOP5-B2-8]
MITTPRWLSTSISFLIALLVGVLLGSVVQTQINLAALQGMGVQIPAMLDTTVNDLLTFAPLYALLFSVGFIFSQTAAVRLSRWLGGRFQALLSAGAAAVLMTPFKAYPGTCHLVTGAGVDALYRPVRYGVLHRRAVSRVAR